MTQSSDDDIRFDEYGHYGENNPPVTQEAKPFTLTPSEENDGFSVEFVKETELPNGEVMLTFDLGDKAAQAASELGLKLLLYLGALEISAEQAFQTIWDTHKKDTDDGN